MYSASIVLFERKWQITKSQFSCELLLQLKTDPNTSILALISRFWDSSVLICESLQRQILIWLKLSESSEADLQMLFTLCGVIWTEHTDELEHIWAAVCRRHCSLQLEPCIGGTPNGRHCYCNDLCFRGYSWVHQIMLACFMSPV